MMKPSLIFAFIVLLICSPIKGQFNFGKNLISNPGFETTRKKINGWTKNKSDFDSAMVNWISPTTGTPDILSKNTALDYFYLINDFGVDHPKTGKNIVGIITFGKNSKCSDYREYILSGLSKPLKVGKEYFFSLWFKPKTRSAYLCNSLGVYFSETSIKQNKCSPIKAVPIYQVEPVLSNADWLKLSFKFTSSKAYKYIVIGNFNPNDLTDCILADSTNRRANSYYFIDDVFLGEVLETPPSTKDTTQLFLPIYFESGKSEISTNQEYKLTSTINFLKEKENLNLKLTGFCDEKGNKEFNKELSVKRATSVQEFLTKKGVQKENIKIEGLGEIGDESLLPDFEKRRVEISIITPPKKI